MFYLIDSYAWVEYFLGSSKGVVLKDFLSQEKNKFYTAAPCLAEINGWALKNQQDFNQILKIITSNSEIIQVSDEEWISAGKERFDQGKTQKDFGMIDSVLLVKQKTLNCKIISGDKHFQHL